MSRWKVAIVLPVLAFVIVLSMQQWQVRRFKEAQASLLNLAEGDISYLAVYRGQFAAGDPLQVTDREEINAFLEGFQDSKRYSPNHELTSLHIAVRIVPQEIHLILSQSEKYERTVSGGIGDFQSGQAYKHYGWFLSEGLYAWHQRQYEEIQNAQIDDP